MTTKKEVIPMLHALGESGEAATGGGSAAIVVLVALFLIWINSYNRAEAEKARQCRRTERKQEIAKILRERPVEDRAIFREVLEIVFKGQIQSRIEAMVTVAW
ncbi:hypothetical protein AB0N37_34355 [Streptomyces griseoincarnatus]